MELCISTRASSSSPRVEEKCRYDDRESVVPVLDKPIDEAPTAGNNYWRHCLSCGRWLLP